MLRKHRRVDYIAECKCIQRSRAAARNLSIPNCYFSHLLTYICISWGTRVEHGVVSVALGVVRAHGGPPNCPRIQKGLRIASAWLQTLSQNGYGTWCAELSECLAQVELVQTNQKSQQHPKDFPGGPPPQYWPGPATVNFGVRKRSGVFVAVWPLATRYFLNTPLAKSMVALPFLSFR